MKGRSIYLESYGCQMNLADSEVIAGQLSSCGFQLVQDPSVADVLLVNTCAIRERAEDRVIGRLAELAALKARKPGAKLVVCGCVAQHQKAALKARLPALDLVVGPDCYRSLPSLLQGEAGPAGSQAASKRVMVKLDRGETYSGIDPLRRQGVSAWVTIMRGCDRFCSFCVVPFVRGRERSRPAAEIVAEVAKLAQSGYREVTFLGQTVTSYRHEDTSFADLLKQAAQVTGIERIRFTSPHPSDITSEVIEAMAVNDKVAPHLHLPLQAGSDRVLQRMGRDYTADEFLGIVARLREAIPDVALSTDIIVGFPSESEADFNATLQIMREVAFDHAFMFKYSRRPHTRAYSWKDTVSEEEKHRRLAEVITLQEEISLERNRQWIGRQVEVLVEGPARRQPQWVSGKTPHFKTAVIRSLLASGTIAKTVVVDASAHTLVGDLSAQLRPGG